MSKEDLRRFIEKVDQLNKMIDSLDQFPFRREQLSSCNTHEQVIELARTWGFQISRRWGDPL
ncbi:Nif11 family protein [Prochlorococcus marinus]|uniref:Nif11 domain-containing protein n=1 Tax=Prochlorococcus marinus (strain MIT 9211) TaxID=93059 RepID=A9BBA5_PROM4|nr:Nif11 family protein [Prochlorococcus marinus]ABX09117.1 Hypothetical protein P9211_11861 [Prochlorococcus marinus str. MIT 9211]